MLWGFLNCLWTVSQSIQAAKESTINETAYQQQKRMSDCSGDWKLHNKVPIDSESGGTGSLAIHTAGACKAPVAPFCSFAGPLVSLMWALLSFLISSPSHHFLRHHLGALRFQCMRTGDTKKSYSSTQVSYLGVMQLGYPVGICLAFWETAKLFSRMARAIGHSYHQDMKV